MPAALKGIHSATKDLLGEKGKSKAKPRSNGIRLVVVDTSNIASEKAAGTLRLPTGGTHADGWAFTP